MIVLLIVADSLKAGAPGFAGGEAKTPVLDQLAKNGAWFDQMFASGAWTIPAMMSILTGALGHKIGVCRWRHPFPAKRPTLFTAFAAAGFETACFHPYPRWGYLTVAGRGPVGNSQDVEAVTKVLKGRKGQDRFVMVHHWWTHLPYINQELPQDKWHVACDFSIDSLSKYPDKIAPKLEDSYLKSVSFFSENILPKYLDAASTGGEDVLVAVTGDHGETWGRSLPKGRNVEQVYDLHGRWITDETIRVPFVVHGKTAAGAVPARPKLGGLVGGIDVGPTLAELAGVPWPGPIPDAAGPDVVDRAETDLDIVGRSLAKNIIEGATSTATEVPTISSHNTFEPKNYPANGKKMWRTMACRNEKGWFVWDGVEKQRTIIPTDPNEKIDDEKADEIFNRLEDQRLQAVDSAPLVPDEDVPGLRTGDEQDAIKKKLSTLGYLD